MGPTASGKTDLAISLLDHMPVELVNVDSAQFIDKWTLVPPSPMLETLKQGTS